MITVQKVQSFTASDNLAVLVRKNADLSPYLQPQQIAFVDKQVQLDKEFIHINALERQLFIIIVPEKKHEWQTLEVLRKQGSDVLKLLQSFKLTSVTIVDSTNSKYGMAVLEGLYLSTYQFLPYFKDTSKKIGSLSEIKYIGDISDEQILQNTVLWQAVFQTRTFINEPVMSLPSQTFANNIAAIAQEKEFSATIHDKQWLEQQQMGGILAVNKGSIDPPFLCVLEWKPENATNQKPIVLVGKGVMYDSGGLSLKPAQYMETMKCDMSGAAAVLGTITAAAQNVLPIHIIVLIPMTDNRPSGNAYAPGDIIKMHDGSFVEVLNTDAEGRMILADALSYAKTFDPQLVIDIATLTGAANAAVGDNASVVMGTADDAHIKTLVDCGFAVHERLVQFPLWDDYAELLKSDMADMKNIGGPVAGAITAGKFLEHFTAYPWIHLDIAGAAYHVKGNDYRGKGASGIGVRLLYSFLEKMVIQ